MKKGAKVKVVFIGGFGRNGSTLLDRMLGQMDGYVSIGELRHIWVRGFQENQLCGCGVPFRECSFWGAVIKEAFGGFDNVDAVETHRLQMTVDRLRYIPQLLSANRSPTFSSRLSDYSAMLEKIYAAVAKVSGCAVIVDSSKDPAHGLILAASRKVDLRYLLLLRDSRAVAFSWMRKRARPEIHWKKDIMPVYSPVRTAAFWAMYNYVASLAAKRGAPFLSVRYEYSVTRTEETLRTISGFIGDEKAPGLDFISGRSIMLKEGHLVAGNPMRFKKGELEIKSDEEWKSSLSPLWKFVVTCMTYPGLKRNGYI